MGDAAEARCTVRTSADSLPFLDRISGALHLAAALAGAALLGGSPWIAMYDRLPEPPGWANLAHVAIGLASLPIGAAYVAGCLSGQRRHECFPWLGGDLAAVGRDLAGIFRGRLPSVEGGGLLPMLEGLLLLGLLAAAITGAAWFFTQGTETAAIAREWHIVAARAFALLLLLHVVGVGLHLLDFVGD
jgi:hypothetical protein